MEKRMLSMKKVADRIDCIDIRTAEKWCRKNNVTIHLEGRKKFVLNIDLENTLEMKYVESLKERYPNCYKEVYYSSKEDDILSLYELTNTTSDVPIETYYTNDTGDSFYEYSEDDMSSDFLKKYEDYL